ncbi:MAG TPA: DUF3387 domain-containing protein, partial [Leptospiraceae bacterium]|nr:DUF3387 domain-containing protein [Leptospiraceae bacterium]
ARHPADEDEEEETPVQDKSHLFTLLDDALLSGISFCSSIGINLNEALDSQGTFKKIQYFEYFANELLKKDIYWKEFKVYENTISSFYEACKPEILESGSRPMIAVFQYLRGVVEAVLGKDKDFETVRQKISELLDQSIITSNPDLFNMEGKPEFQIVKAGNTLDLSKIDFEKLKEEFKEKQYKNIEIAILRDFIEKKLEEMLKENSTRFAFAEKLNEIINRYNSGGMSAEYYYNEFQDFAKNLKTEDERYIREGLTKDELELFDILKKEKMTKAEEIKVKNAAKHLLKRLVEEQPKVLVQDWFKDTQTQANVKSAIEEVLDEDLPNSYDKELFQQKTKQLFGMIFDYASRGFKWAAA